MTPTFLVPPLPLSVQMLHNLSTSLAHYIDHVRPLEDELRLTEALDHLRRATALLPATKESEMQIHRDLADLFSYVSNPEDYEQELCSIASEMIADAARRGGRT